MTKSVINQIYFLSIYIYDNPIAFTPRLIVNGSEVSTPNVAVISRRAAAAALLQIKSEDVNQTIYFFQIRKLEFNLCREIPICVSKVSVVRYCKVIRESGRARRNPSQIRWNIWQNAI
jgi:hypothetical protein